MKRIIIYTVCLLGLLKGYSQGLNEAAIIDAYSDYKFNNPLEYSFVATDRQIYFTGESIKLSAIIFDQYHLPTTLSKVCYLELIHESDEYSTKYALRLDSGIVNDQISLPTDIPTGNYQLVVHTKFMQNFEVEQYAHRLPLYIQNTLDAPKAVCRKVDYEKSEFMPVLNNQVDITLNNTDSKVFLEFNNLSTAGSYFLVSEGLRGIQFVAKVDLKQGRTNIGIAKEKFQGNLQKLILIGDKEVVVIKCFYLEGSNQPSTDFLERTLNSKLENNSLTWIAVYDQEPFYTRSQALMKHVYRLFYKLPRSLNTEMQSFEELTSESMLDSFSKYSLKEWESILKAEKKVEIKYYPEENIQLKGRVEGATDLISNSSIIFHFFKNDLDLSVPLDNSGEFLIDLVFPVGQDYVSFSVVENKSLKDISDKVVIEVDENVDFSYIPTVSFYDKNVTDDYINDQLEFKYALSTFYNQDRFKTYFWEDYSFDMTFKSDDYVRLEDFEDFIKEAVMNVSVVEDKGSKSVNVYNGFNGSFEKPQLIIHNNRAIRDESELFDLSFDQIDSVLVAFNDETIRKFGNSFSKGILAVVSSSSNYTESNERMNNFMPFTGYHHFEQKNPVTKPFESTLFFGINRNDYEDKLLAEEEYKIYIQTIGKDGRIDYFSEKQLNK
ncbi:hypothetical protein [Ekhidna sp.]|uniref:hypothetical protein n=1 Tax=Ekhidna sp. TaxID=2608089 RepID=UPI003CCBCCAE